MTPAPGSAPRFAMRGIRKAFGATIAVDEVDFAVAAGEVCALVGENGAGKSTLMGILSGAVQPDSGEMTIEGSPYRPSGPLDARQAGVAMIYQELSLAPHLSVMENILLGMEPSRRGLVRWEEMRQTAVRALAALNHSDIDPDAPVDSLSTAEQQLVEIARALAVGCRVLVLDEPTSSLTRADALRLFDLIRDLRRQGHAIVYISHFIEEVREVADRFVVLRDGKKIGEGSTGSSSAEDIVRMMVGRRVDDLYHRSARQRGEAILDVDVRFPAGSLLRAGEGAAAFTLHRGEILGIAGLLGAGRTHLLRAIFGLDPIRTGRVRLAVHTGPFPPYRRWEQGMGMLSEDRKGEGLALGLSVADNIALTRLDGLGPARAVLPSRKRAAATKWTDRLGIRCRDVDQSAAELSGGNQQKVAFARLLHHDVDVLILDEPTRGIDVGSKAQLYVLLDALVSADRPKAVLMVSSYLPELLGMCDRIAVMHRGTLGPARPVEAFDEHRLMLEATGAA
ncbi:MAG: sugar ABC transporter ATP-binding protein [Acidobacteria bacterium]|nr:sugar ABC transporter ATP-binding protein [Acidobacteriota bacterium]